MQTTPESDALLVELFERASIVADLDGPQAEAWVSGIFALFSDDLPAERFVSYCADRPSAVSAMLCHVIAELATGSDDELATTARAVAEANSSELPAAAAQIGESTLAWAWSVQAPFGRSIVLGFDNPVTVMVIGEDDEPADLRHSVLAELDSDGMLEDLQLAGPPQALLDEAVDGGDRVAVEDLDTRDAAQLVIAAWPTGSTAAGAAGPGLGANQQFVRRRLLQATGTQLPSIVVEVQSVDIRRGLDDDGFALANQAARSTLQAAVGLSDEDGLASEPEHRIWIGVIRGDGGDLSARERDGLLWLEWADWLGVGIGLLRTGAGAAVDGASFVDYVNRCPEVSSTIDKVDRDYAEWAFGVAIDLLEDAGLIADGALTNEGHQTLGPALVAAWGQT